MTTPDTPTNPPLRLRAGAYYRTRDGRRVGPLEAHANTSWPYRIGGEFYSDGQGVAAHAYNGQCYSHKYGRDREDTNNLVSEWADLTPVQTHTTTRTVIVQGQYGIVQVAHTEGDRVGVFIAAGQALYTATELRAAAATLTQLADGLDRIAEERNEPK